MDKQDIPEQHRDLLLEIARCNVADKVLDLLMSGMNENEILEKLRNERQPDESVCIKDCVKICSHQQELLENSDSKQKFTKAVFHVPEPWSGNLRSGTFVCRSESQHRPK